MRRTFIFLPLMALAVAIVGCNAPSAPSDSKGMPKDGQTNNADKIKKAMAELPADERAMAEAQKICPQSDHALGSMGKPVKVMLKGQPVFICCSSCKSAVEKDQDGILKKVAELKKK